MRRLRLIRLSLRNFKGVRDLDIDARGEDISIFGDNATGKTTIADAWFWLLFDRDSEGKKDFEIKTLDENGAPIRGLLHSVEAEIDVEGRALTLKRAYREVWTKKRGRADAEFAGHTTEFWINGVPVQKKEYDAAVAEICDERALRVLSDPRFFNEQLHWQDRRSILVSVCGDVSDEDVYASSEALAELPALLEGRTLEDFRRIAVSRRREINEQLKRIPAVINELRSMETPDSVASEAECMEELQALRAQRVELLEKSTRLQAGGEVSELTKRLRETEAALQAAESRVLKTWTERLRELQKERDERAAEAARAARHVEVIAEEIRHIEGRLDRLEAARKDLLDAYGAEQARTFSFEGADSCPACGQPLPAAKVEEARAKAADEWNSDRAQRLERIVAEGREVRSLIEHLNADLAAKKDLLDTASQTGEEFQTAARNALAQCEAFETSRPEPTDDPEYERLAGAAQEIERKIAQLREGVTDAVEEVRAEIASVDERIAEIERKIAQFAEAKKRTARINDLIAEERSLASEYQRLESALFLCEEFVRAKVRLLTDRINARFEIARFKLFAELVNGGVEECCSTTVDGVPYSSLNGGMRMNVGLDIINTLAEHYGFAPVIIIDNAESVTQLLATHGQQIRLAVRSADKKLRVEHTKQEALF